MSSIEFNAKLPVSVEVIERKFFDKYILKLGTQRLECKSRKSLEVGRMYWAELKRSSTSSIIISGLIKKPDILEYMDYFFSFQSFDAVFEVMADIKKFKEMILKSLAEANSKKEFLFYTNLLLSMQSGVVTIPLLIDSKFFFLQFKREAHFIRIYFLFSNLAPVLINLDSLNQTLNILVSYESSLRILQEELETLVDFSVQSIMLKKDIKPIFDFKNSLLDLKG